MGALVSRRVIQTPKSTKSVNQMEEKKKLTSYLKEIHEKYKDKLLCVKLLTILRSLAPLTSITTKLSPLFFLIELIVIGTVSLTAGYTGYKNIVQGLSVKRYMCLDLILLSLIIISSLLSVFDEILNKVNSIYIICLLGYFILHHQKSIEITFYKHVRTQVVILLFVLGGITVFEKYQYYTLSSWLGLQTVEDKKSVQAAFSNLLIQLGLSFSLVTNVIFYRDRLKTQKKIEIENEEEFKQKLQKYSKCVDLYSFLEEEEQIRELVLRQLDLINEEISLLENPTLSTDIKRYIQEKEKNLKKIELYRRLISRNWKLFKGKGGLKKPSLSGLGGSFRQEETGGQSKRSLGYGGQSKRLRNILRDKYLQS